jgi:hypothetical protein
MPQGAPGGYHREHHGSSSQLLLLHDGVFHKLPAALHAALPPHHPSVQVPGCSADLSAEPKAYCLRKRICTTHMQAEVLQYPGNQWCRYCFQCAKVEPLGLFDGNKK